MHLRRVLLLGLGVASALVPQTQRTMVAQPGKAAGLPKLPPAVLGIASAVAPLVALAAQDDYEYGAVNAPGWVLPVGALTVIATALLPLALQAGDDAQREMAERDSSTFGKGKSPLEK
mmetsp:Transcript_4281/g.10977  ORF Transcript_4281/g.10977 Transcript_4281/m.10977 type:complete len:118 (+) Transcript_4281:63-416(+)